MRVEVLCDRKTFAFFSKTFAIFLKIIFISFYIIPSARQPQNCLVPFYSIMTIKRPGRPGDEDVGSLGRKKCPKM